MNEFAFRLFMAFLLLAVGVCGLYMMYGVHCLLNNLAVWYAKRFCRNLGLAVSRGRYRIAFDESGMKTECTLVELDCLDAQGQRRLVRLLVWMLGVRQLLSNEGYPNAYDKEWPQDGEEGSAESRRGTA